MAALLVGLGACQSRAAIVEFAQVSSPAGIVVQTNYLSTPTNLTTVTAPAASGSWRFTQWRVNGVRSAHPDGSAMNPAVFTLLEPTVAEASYLAATQDDDADTVPDWFEIFYYNSPSNAPTSDTDGDGYTLLEEFTYALNPLTWDPRPTLEVVAGGISRARSGSVTMNLDQSPTYRLVSDPPGFVGVTNVVTNGTVVTTANLWGQSVSGYRFTHWDFNGVRQQDAAGVAVGGFTFTVTADCVATAHYLPQTQDLDADTIPDWFEVVYFGHLTHEAGSDPDGDGYTLAEELAYGLNPFVI